jgi:hypothetical protein
MISPKQLIGESLDLAALMLRELIDVYCNINNFELPFANQVLARYTRKTTLPS